MCAEYGKITEVNLKSFLEKILSTVFPGTVLTACTVHLFISHAVQYNI